MSKIQNKYIANTHKACPFSQILIRLAHLALCGVGPLSQQHTISTCGVLTQQGVLCSRLRASSAHFPAKRLYLIEFLSVPLEIFTQLRLNHPLSGHKFSARYLFSFPVCLSAEGAKNVSGPRLPPLREWGSRNIGI